MYVHRSASSVVVRAPAKLNLFFEVLARRDDGFHEVETLMVPVSLFDTLIACNEPTGRLHLSCLWEEAPARAKVAASLASARGELPPMESNLAYRAVALLREQAGVAAGISLQLRKRIPAESGLGGGSSDAAAALVAANRLWNLNYPPEQLAELAAQLGSDVPFFLGRGAAVCRGRGERIDLSPRIAPLHVVLVRPPVGLATAPVYRHCQVPDRPRSLAPLLAALAAGDWRDLATRIFNRLQPAAAMLSPWIERLHDEFAQAGCVAHQMSGSGTSYFGICQHARHARRIAQKLQARGLGRVYALSTCN